MAGRVTATLQSKGKERYDVYDMTSQRRKKKGLDYRFSYSLYWLYLDCPKADLFFPINSHFS